MTSAADEKLPVSVTKYFHPIQCLILCQFSTILGTEETTKSQKRMKCENLRAWDCKNFQKGQKFNADYIN